ncbi:hypothetical protein CBR_g40648 [Chara braunii]|uniref:Small ribosomal subunit protein mS29 n=1 Tax=Chara braunii TaxID=69332 RepID=A0A388LU35_CHABU|nr:hypothetical protein CBR_g40648 [Chara braunii]|eukprot:GBG85838.1 hypothetical protein CBR_g40648 [Chara braunii]
MSGVYSSVGRVARGVINCTIGAWKRIGYTIANAAIGIGTGRYSSIASSSSSSFPTAIGSDVSATSASLIGRLQSTVARSGPAHNNLPGAAVGGGGGGGGVTTASFVRRALPLHFPFSSWLPWAARSLTTAIASKKIGGAAASSAVGNAHQWEEAIFTRVTDPSFLSYADVNKYFVLSSANSTPFLHISTNTSRFRLDGAHIGRRPFGRNFLLDGPVGSGKSVALATAVHWARASGWLVFYVPSGRDWIKGGFFQKHAQTNLWDTPVAAKNALQGLMNSHEDLLAALPLKVPEPIPVETIPTRPGRLGPAQSGEPANENEGASGSGAGEEISGGGSLRDLVSRGLKMTQANALVSCVVRVRKELSQVTDVPVLIAIDEFNSWFGYSDYQESRGPSSRRNIRAEDLRMVNAFRSMVDSPLENGVMVAANSNSTATVNLPVTLPGVPQRVRFEIPRYNAQETATALNYYHRCNIGFDDPTADDIKRMFFLTAGNGDELRTLAHLL